MDHREGTPPTDELHQHAAERIAGVDALIFGRTTYELMEFWREEAARPDAGTFARTIDAARKYVVSSTLDHLDWNAELVRPEELEATARWNASLTAMGMRPARGERSEGALLVARHQRRTPLDLDVLLRGGTAP